MDKLLSLPFLKTIHAHFRIHRDNLYIKHNQMDHQILLQIALGLLGRTIFKIECDVNSIWWFCLLTQGELAIVLLG